jgi:hypothetical protein
MSNAVVKLRRKRNLVDCLAELSLLVDDKQVGTIGNGEEELFKIAPGYHKIYVQDSMQRQSNIIELNLSTDDVRSLECGIVDLNSMPMRIYIPLMLYYIITPPMDDYLDSMFHAKHVLLYPLIIIFIVLFGVWIGRWWAAKNNKPGAKFYLIDVTGS